MQVARLEAHEKEKTSKKRDASTVDDASLNQGKKAKSDLNGSSVTQDIDGYTIAELRSALAKRGLSTTGTKKTLHSRLSEALQADGNDKADDDNGASIFASSFITSHQTCVNFIGDNRKVLENPLQ